jgi:hypothetical protein
MPKTIEEIQAAAAEEEGNAFDLDLRIVSILLDLERRRDIAKPCSPVPLLQALEANREARARCDNLPTQALEIVSRLGSVFDELTVPTAKFADELGKHKPFYDILVSELTSTYDLENLLRARHIQKGSFGDLRLRIRQEVSVCVQDIQRHINVLHRWIGTNEATDVKHVIGWLKLSTRVYTMLAHWMTLPQPSTITLSELVAVLNDAFRDCPPDISALNQVAKTRVQIRVEVLRALHEDVYAAVDVACKVFEGHRSALSSLK